MLAEEPAHSEACARGLLPEAADLGAVYFQWLSRLSRGIGSCQQLPRPAPLLATAPQVLPLPLPLASLSKHCRRSRSRYGLQGVNHSSQR